MEVAPSTTTSSLIRVGTLEKAGFTSHVESLPAYVYRALRNRVVDYQRSRKNTISLDSCVDEDGEIALIDLLGDESSSVTGRVERREFFRKLGQALDRLEAKQRAVFLATEFAGKSFKSLSTEWGEPIGTLLSRKSRAVKALREMLKDY
jgi:RNA polymerase sigma factor (sigma-70 family)